MAQNVRLNALVRDKLSGLPAALESEIGVTATQEEIVAALIYAATPVQLASILPVYKRNAAKASDAPGEGT